jgi:hypothetical protein
LNPAIGQGRGGVRASRAERSPAIAGGIRAARLSHYLLIFAAAWMIAMTWRVYPQFKDMLKVEDRLVTLDDYVEESCGQRIGPAAASCVGEARLTGRRLVARQQGQSLLFVIAPLLAYVAIYLPVQRMAARRPSTGVGE